MATKTARPSSFHPRPPIAGSARRALDEIPTIENPKPIAFGMIPECARSEPHRRVRQRWVLFGPILTDEFKTN